MRSSLLTGMLATMALVNTVGAATSTCPSIQAIKQTAMINGGYRYEASQPDGRAWTGENPLAAASYLNDSTFHDARYDANNKTVTCTYKGPMNNDASFSVALKPVSAWNLIPPIGEWKGTYCEALAISKCSFTHQ
ncbi:hypothetical protein [Pseudomonas pergaminensis]|uniref:DUF3757 domain-containing protein n=1 Tax=Pseudomonas pergaminensis TaxID=2853159 RepID=A0ABW8QUP9_9PSED